jgi:hypothetical protein
MLMICILRQLLRLKILELRVQLLSISLRFRKILVMMVLDLMFGKLLTQM